MNQGYYHGALYLSHVAFWELLELQSMSSLVTYVWKWKIVANTKKTSEKTKMLNMPISPEHSWFKFSQAHMTHSITNLLGTLLTIETCVFICKGTSGNIVKPNRKI